MPDQFWYKDAVIYQAHVRVFFDSNGDGVGDFPGLTQKLDYLQSLGINCLWLLPFYPSPLRDDGYDIADYENIHPSYGTLDDFERFVGEAHRRNIRVVTELVVNHTSDQHPWFQAARRAPAGSPEREFYVWSDTKQKYQLARIIFSDTESSNWSWDDTAGAYYWHRFFHHQPDLNYDNPEVLARVIKVMEFWLDRGVDGLRLDAVPYLIEREGTTCENLDESHQVLKTIRAALDARYSDRVLLAEANQWPADVRPYFGDGDECHMAFHFPLMPRMFMGIRQEDRHPITEILRQTPDLPERCQWAMFLRNHDELTLEMVTDDERDYMYQVYAADPRMRINVGIRRRLAPLLENSRRRIELMTALLFSMPGTPVIYYGDEIGMGDNIYLGDRNGVRTPMQWTGDRNGGFSRADPASLYAPSIMDAVYGYQAVNVEAEERSPYSLLNWMKQMIGLRKQTTVFGRGTIEFLPARNRKVLPYVRRLQNEVVLCVANLSRSVQPIELDLSQFKGMTPVEMFGLTEFPKIGDHPYFLTLGPYSFYWFKVEQTPASVTARTLPETATDVPEAPALLVGATWETLLDGNVRTLIERDLLIPFLQRQGWFAGKSRRIRSARFIDWGLLRRAPQPLFVTIVEVEFDEGHRHHYFLPLTICASADARGLAEHSPHAILANVTGARKGVLFDGWLDDRYVRTLFDALEREEPMPTGRGTVRAIKTPTFAAKRSSAGEDPSIARMSVEQRNTSIVYGDRLILKLFRRIQPGMNPDLEISLQLTQRAGFNRVPAVAGALEYHTTGTDPATLAMMQDFVKSQGDGWTHALGEVGRFYEDVGDDAAPVVKGTAWMIEGELPEAAARAMGAYPGIAATLGRRTAEMHLALASDSTNRAFVPERLVAGDLERLTADATGRARQALQQLASMHSSLPEDVRRAGDRLLQSRDTLLERIRSAPRLEFVASRIRVHGDYHLGQVLLSEGDFYILDFEGEPARPLSERRLKQSPLKDVAGMIRSFGYAAYAALFAHTASRPSELARLEPWARIWQLCSSSAFLGAYFAAVAGALFVPAAPAERDGLLELFVIDKMLTELGYELNNRPDWARIPLRGLLDLLNVPR